ncbi:MAG: Type 1 glutamine amidotransferase-like domain-containing protein [Oscillospiraceae bacterium]|nr:Type 1 glutamine amidotransferase-like domain-containing protein [Oscillospiraceae bacterium]
MKKLFLASYFSGAASAFTAFAGDCNGKKVAFIPTASLPEKMSFYVGADRKALLKLGMEVEDLEVSTAATGEIEAKIAAADCIFVSGGNTFFLLQELRRTGADKLIAAHIEIGKLYIGASAGSMVLAPNIEYVKHMDKPTDAPELNGDFAALGIVPFSVVPHFANFPFKKATEKIVASYSGTLDLRPIANHQAVTVVGDKIEVVSAEAKKKAAKEKK